MGNTICEELAKGRGLKQICRTDPSLPDPSTVRNWTYDYPDFNNQYLLAREKGMDALGDELIEIADDGTNDYMDRERRDGRIVTEPNPELIARSKLRIQTRQWLMGKVAAKKWGDKTALEVSGPQGAPLQSVNVNTADPVEAARAYQKLMHGDNDK